MLLFTLIEKFIKPKTDKGRFKKEKLERVVITEPPQEAKPVKKKKSRIKK
ncbi:MAG: hypothetical protein ABIA04_15650 [Pseudomonadota bacterium]